MGLTSEYGNQNTSGSHIHWLLKLFNGSSGPEFPLNNFFLNKSNLYSSDLLRWIISLLSSAEAELQAALITS